MDSGNDVQGLPPVVVPEGIDWETTTAEYASLLGMSQRTAQQEDRYFDLSRLVSRRPPPWMTPAEQTEHVACVERTEQAMFRAALAHVRADI